MRLTTAALVTALALSTLTSTPAPAKEKPHSVTLTWVHTPHAYRYRIYRRRADQQNWTPIGNTDKTRWRDRHVHDGERWQYGVSAVDKKGNESATAITPVTAIPEQPRDN